METEECRIECAHRMIRDGQRDGGELFPLPAFEPEATHLAAALRYQQRNLAEGKCAVCPKPLAHNSVRFCETHLAKDRTRNGPKGQPGSIDYLYGNQSEPTHGR